LAYISAKSDIVPMLYALAVFEFLALLLTPWGFFFALKTRQYFIRHKIEA